MQALKALSVSAVLNMAPQTCGSLREHYTGSGFEVLEEDADDAEGYGLLEKHFQSALQFLDDMRRQGRRTLVHCFAGMNRSATICVAYLIVREEMGLTDAVQLLREKRGVVLKNRSFNRELVALAREYQLRGVRKWDFMRGDRVLAAYLGLMAG